MYRSLYYGVFIYWWWYIKSTHIVQIVTVESTTCTEYTTDVYHLRWKLTRFGRNQNSTTTTTPTRGKAYKCSHELGTCLRQIKIKRPQKTCKETGQSSLKKTYKQWEPPGKEQIVLPIVGKYLLTNVPEVAGERSLSTVKLLINTPGVYSSNRQIPPSV